MKVANLPTAASTAVCVCSRVTCRITNILRSEMAAGAGVFVHVTVLTAIVAVLVYRTILCHFLRVHQSTNQTESFDVPEDFEFFDNEIGTLSGKYLVPNIVHFIIWKDKISFMEAVCLLAAVFNQKPDKLYVHTDRNISGKYWQWALAVPEVEPVLEVKYLAVPSEIFGQDLAPWYEYHHGSDIGRLQVLMEHGGIFLDSDSFLVQSLDEFRKFEMTLGWGEGKMLANQAIVAHKNARFLRKWMNSYRHHYWSNAFTYNTMERPTRTVLERQPHLVHRMLTRFVEDPLGEFLYLQDDDSWRDHYVIHLSLRWWVEEGEIGANLSSTATYPVIFNETNIMQYNCTLRQMVQSVVKHFR